MLTLKAIEDFLAWTASTAYVEPVCDFHRDLTKKTWLWFCNVVLSHGDFPGPSGAPPVILDVGCADGFAMEIFKADGSIPIGVTVLPAERDVCEGKGLTCCLRDMHDIADICHPDAIWAASVIEHSPMPAFVLRQFYEMLAPGGWLYLQTALADSPCNHQKNKNHWSVLPKSMWEQLIVRAGFVIEDAIEIKFRAPVGEDVYYGWACRKV
jgi:SAM-dependent methyltransferase